MPWIPPKNNNENLDENDPDLAWAIRKGGRNPDSLTPEEISAYRDKFIDNNDINYVPPGAEYYSDEEPQRPKEPADLLKPFLKHPRETPKAYAARTQANLEELNQTLAQADDADTTTYSKVKGKGRRKASREADHYSDIHQQLMKDISNNIPGLETTSDGLVRKVGKSDTPGYGQ